MKKTSIETPSQAVKMPKAEAIEKLSQHGATYRAQLATAKAQLQAAVSPDKYALNFQVNALKRQVNFCKDQITRLKKEPKAEVIWDPKFGA
jgi:cell division protein FtsB